MTTETTTNPTKLTQYSKIETTTTGFGEYAGPAEGSVKSTEELFALDDDAGREFNRKFARLVKDHTGLTIEGFGNIEIVRRVRFLLSITHRG